MARILLAEDEHNIRLFMSSVLHKLGHEVVAAKDGAEALECLQSHPPFNLLLTDILMPRLDGYGLIQAVVPLFPTIIIIAVSASPSEALRAAELAEITVLTKPFTHQELVDTVRGALSSMSTFL